MAYELPRKESEIVEKLIKSVFEKSNELIKTMKEKRKTKELYNAIKFRNELVLRKNFGEQDVLLSLETLDIKGLLLDSLEKEYERLNDLETTLKMQISALERELENTNE